MKIRVGHHRRTSGFTLLECIGYIAVLGVLLNVAYPVFFQAWSDNKALRRNAEDISRALRAGEQWRADIRAATGPIQVADDGGVQQARIPSADGSVLYVFSDGQVRRTAATGLESVWLPSVKSSRMLADARGAVPAWRWEVELKAAGKIPRVRPLFTFESVAGGAVAK